jgi:hypothetical protein
MHHVVRIMMHRIASHDSWMHSNEIPFMNV